MAFRFINFLYFASAISVPVPVLKQIHNESILLGRNVPIKI